MSASPWYSRVSSGRKLNAFLIIVLLLVVVLLTQAATPNPGHPWTQVGDGVIQFNAPSALRTYTLPDSNATLLTNVSFTQGDILYGTAASTTALLPKNTNATRYLANTGSNNNPQWDLINLSNGATGTLPIANGGLGTSNIAFTGPTSFRTFTLPDATSTILTSNAAVTLAQGGTGAALTASNGGIIYSGASTLSVLAGVATSSRLLMSGSNNSPTWSTSTYPSQAGWAGKTLVSNGTNYEDATTTQNTMYRTMQAVKNAGGATVTNLGFPAAPTLTATAANSDDAAGPWLLHYTSNVSGNSSGLISAAFTYFRRDWEPDYVATIQTGTSTASIGYWVGMFSASPDNNAAPNIHAAAFRYYTSVDSTAFWRAVTIAGTGASATISTTTVAVATTSNYLMRIRCNLARCEFFINGQLVATHTTTLPTATQLMGYGNRVTTLNAANKSIRWGRVSVNHK